MESNFGFQWAATYAVLLFNKEKDSMQEGVQILASYWWVLPLVAALVGYKFVLRLFGVVIIPDGHIGEVTKKFVLFGANKELPPGKIIALNGEAGSQADTEAPGLKLWYWPWQYEVAIMPNLVVPNGSIGIVESCDGKPMADGHILGCEVPCDNFQDARAFLKNGGERGGQMAIIPPGTWRINSLVFKVKIAEMTTVPQGKIGLVEALDGKPLSNGMILGRNVECDSFQDAKAFMDKGGERGPQMPIIPQGQYRINPKLFKVTLADVTDVSDNMVGVVTTKEGTPLSVGEIAGAQVEGHDSYQNPQAFVTNGGRKGLQEQVLLAGRYFINSFFATVQMQPMTKVPIANVGVVIAYVGKAGVDVTGDNFKHANIVSRGEKGVWLTPLDPGMYPINPFTHKVELVPTANVVLNWATGKTEAHKLDERLSTITVRSSDGFTFNLDVSQIISVPRNDAPLVIAQFGTMANLVTQVLEPTIGNYFRNAAQKSDVIQFLSSRSERQAEAREAIKVAIVGYNVNAIDTLIGDITPPEQLMKTLTDRKIAEQQKITYGTEKLAEDTRKELEQARALATTQARVVDAERSVQIADFTAQAAVKQAEGQAGAKTKNAEADAMVLRTVGAAEGEKITAVGGAEAAIIQLKTNAVGQSNFAQIEVARHLSTSHNKWVPEIMVAGNGSQGSNGMLDVIMGTMIKDQMVKAKPSSEAPEASNK